MRRGDVHVAHPPSRGAYSNLLNASQTKQRSKRPAQLPPRSQMMSTWWVASTHCTEHFGPSQTAQQSSDCKYRNANAPIQRGHRKRPNALRALATALVLPRGHYGVWHNHRFRNVYRSSPYPANTRHDGTVGQADAPAPVTAVKKYLVEPLNIPLHGPPHAINTRTRSVEKAICDATGPVFRLPDRGTIEHRTK